jgi:type IV secretion system protein VirB6
MGIGTFVEGAIDTSLTNYVTTYSHAVIGVLQPVAVTAVTSYVLWTGFQVMRGEAQDAVSSLVWKWFRVAMITGLALNGPTYQSIVTDGLDGIQGAFATAFGGGPTVGATVDHMAAPFYSLMEQLFTDGSVGLVPQFSLYIAGTLAAVAALVMGFIAMGMYLVAKVSLAILLAIGPAFIFCAMFPVTQRYAESWLSAALASVFVNVLIMATVSFMTSIMHTACTQILAGYSTTSIVVDTCGLLLLSLTCAYVLIHLQSLGATLAGSMSFGNAGGALASIATGVGMRHLARTLANVGSTKSPAGTLTNTSGGSNGNGHSGPRVALPAPTMPSGADLYQRGVLERAQRST